jgi:hypothetical protein
MTILALHDFEVHGLLNGTLARIVRPMAPAHEAKWGVVKLRYGDAVQGTGEFKNTKFTWVGYDASDTELGMTAKDDYQPPLPLPGSTWYGTETWAASQGNVWYVADDTCTDPKYDGQCGRKKHRPASDMPERAARFEVTCTSLYGGFTDDVTEDEAIAAGYTPITLTMEPIEPTTVMINGLPYVAASCGGGYLSAKDQLLARINSEWAWVASINCTQRKVKHV